MPERVPRTPTRLRRAIEGIGSDFVPYIGAIKDINLGSRGLETTGLGKFGNLDVDTLNFNANVISDSTGTISFDNDDLASIRYITASMVFVSNVHNYLYVAGIDLRIQAQSKLILDPYANVVDLLDNNLTTTGTLEAHDTTITGDGVNQTLTINQGADDKGFRIYGHDDQSEAFFQLYIGVTGASVFDGMKSMLLDSATGYDFAIATGQNLILKLKDDNTGTDYVQIIDSDAAQVWKCDSDGNVTGIGTLAVHDVTITGDGTNQALTINQGADHKGIEVKGFDDQSSSYIRMNLYPAGDAQITSSGAWIMNSQGGYVYIISSASFFINLGDNAGTYEFKVRDSDSVVVFNVNSDGDVKIEGALNHDGSNIGFFGTAPVVKQTVADQGAWAAISAGTDQVDLADLNTKVQVIRDKLQAVIDGQQAYGLA